MKLFRCRHCGNIAHKIYDSQVPMVCCGEKMEELIPNTSDGAGEKHVPVIERDGDVLKVFVGEVPHPMIKEHYITHIFLEVENRLCIGTLNYDDKPCMKFNIKGFNGKITVYEYCNIHGLWKAEYEL